MEASQTQGIKLGLLYYKFGDIKKANEIFTKSIDEISSHTVSNSDLIKIYNSLGHHFYDHEAEKAIYFFEQELGINNHPINALSALSELYFFQGEIFKANEYAKASVKAIRKETDNLTKTSLYNNLIMIMHYNPAASLEELSLTAQHFYQNCIIPEIRKNKVLNGSDTFVKAANHKSLRTVKSKINIGFVSADFRKHALYYWFKDFLKDENFLSSNIYLYQNSAEDEISEIYKKQVKNLRNISNQSDSETYHQIKKDEIDILVDLSGHTAGNKLSLFALKPAEVQITWLGQSGPMGLPEIDYMLSAEYFVENKEEKYYQEKISRLAHYYAPYSYHEVEAHKNINPKIPYAKNQFISFGSANSLIKTNSEVIDTWIQILKGVPKSKLFLKNRFLNDSSIKNKIQAKFANAGLSEERIRLSGSDERNSYMNFYNQIDIALDPFPLGGGTTSLDALSMGIPIITLYGKHAAHRNTYALNMNLGLDVLCSFSKEEYINKAITLAEKPLQIQSYRDFILKNFKQSNICNIKDFTKEFEAHLKSLLQ